MSRLIEMVYSDPVYLWVLMPMLGFSAIGLVIVAVATYMQKTKDE